MPRKTLINLEIPESENAGLGLLAAQQGIPAAEVVRKAVKNLDNSAVLLMVAHELEQPVPEGKPIVKRTGMYLDPQDVTFIDLIAQKLLSTRNRVIHLIIRGILSGVVR